MFQCCALLALTAACFAQSPLVDSAASPADTDPQRNVALGRPVAFAPPPNYDLTSAGNTDPQDLTDGKLSAHGRGHMWFERQCVGWRYAGMCNLSLDLGASQVVGEVAIRWQGGSPQAGIAEPGWVKLVGSEDGKDWRVLAEYSKFRPGDREAFGIPRDEGVAFVHRMRFRDLNVACRYIGLQVYTTAITVADELYVFRADRMTRKVADLPRVDFTTSAAQIHFHKPTLYFTTNINTPNPIGLISADGKARRGELAIELPADLQLVGGAVGGQKVADAKVEDMPNGGARYTFSVSLGAATKTFGRIYLTGNWQDGQRGELRYQLTLDGQPGEWFSQPIEAITIQAAAPPKRLLTTLGWWSLEETMSWPGGLDAQEALGFNTVPLFSNRLNFEDPTVTDFLAEIRRRGFKLLNIDSPLHRMIARHAKDTEIYCQLPGGPGAKLCPSYRGQWYREEIEREAREAAACRPDYVAYDIEVWDWRGSVDAEKCSRCQADKAASGIDSWNDWRAEKGYEMWRDMVLAVREAVSKAGGRPPVDMGGYDFRAGMVYQNIWPFDRLYPEYMQSSQVSTYTPLEPYHIALIGDEVRLDRSRLPKSDVVPWITPGDAGTFSGEAFRCALLECFCNGARGIYFWSSRVWDSEILDGYARAIRNVAPVEDIIVDGELLTGIEVSPANVRVSGMRRGEEMVLLVAEYYTHEPLTVSLKLPVKAPATVTDLDTGEDLGIARVGQPFEVRLSFGDRARILWVR